MTKPAATCTGLWSGPRKVYALTFFSPIALAGHTFPVDNSQRSVKGFLFLWQINCVIYSCDLPALHFVEGQGQLTPMWAFILSCDYATRHMFDSFTFILLPEVFCTGITLFTHSKYT